MTKAPPHLDQEVSRFIAGSVDVIHASSIAAEAQLIDEEIEAERAEQEEQAVLNFQAEGYKLLRRLLISQAHGDYDAGAKLMTMLQEVEGRLTEEAFDECMERTLRRMGVAA